MLINETEWRLVPIEPTLEMVIAGENWIGRHAWKRMLKAAPTPPAATAAPSDTAEFTLRAMASNYTARQLWDHLDERACIKAADEIRDLRALLARHGAQPAVPQGFTLIPLRPTQAMRDVMDSEDWAWADLLAAAESITEQQYGQLAQPAASAEPVLYTTEFGGHLQTNTHATRAEAETFARNVNALRRMDREAAVVVPLYRAAPVAAQALALPDDFLPSVKRLAIAARTTGGTAGRDEGLCAALTRVEQMLEAIGDPDWQAQANQRAGAQTPAANGDALAEAVAEFRQAFVVAVGDKSPFAKTALARLDAAMRRTTGSDHD